MENTLWTNEVFLSLPVDILAETIGNWLSQNPMNYKELPEDLRIMQALIKVRTKSIAAYAAAIFCLDDYRYYSAWHDWFAIRKELTPQEKVLTPLVQHFAKDSSMMLPKHPTNVRKAADEWLELYCKKDRKGLREAVKKEKDLHDEGFAPFVEFLLGEM